MLQHVSEFHCFLCLNSILLCADFTFRVYIHMITSGLFPLLTIVNNVAMIEKMLLFPFILDSQVINSKLYKLWYIKVTVQVWQVKGKKTQVGLG